jgi:hypothetical protein
LIIDGNKYDNLKMYNIKNNNYLYKLLYKE